MIGTTSHLSGKPITNPLAKDAVMKVLVSPEQGWQDHVMRVIELGPDGYTPFHSHPWPHINYVIEGQGELRLGETLTPVEAGAYAFIPAGTEHQFRNAGTAKFSFICIVPKEGHI
ncbi:MAG TPA: cupin domain-containing protein [Candidatus Izemoplasmatales bacterium]|nr:cupin domain-containing protein [Bacillota bacterium]HRY77822.1 cupin domain-containing protein [Candidatus Izemoplasmatales bacterium]